MMLMKVYNIYIYCVLLFLSQSIAVSKCQYLYKILDQKKDTYIQEASPLKYENVDSLTDCGLLGLKTDSVMYTFKEKDNICYLHQTTNGNISVNLYPRERKFFVIKERISKRCPNSTWKSFDDRCYLFSSDALAWNDAKDKCRTLDAHLVRIENNETNEFIKSIVVLLGGRSHFLGGNDIGKEGRWIWEDNGALLSYTDWKIGNPNNKNKEHGQDCLLMQASGSESWNDLPCHLSKRYICETPMNKAIHKFAYPDSKQICTIGTKTCLEGEHIELL